MNVFDGKNEKLINNGNVLVEANPLEDLYLVAYADKIFVVIMNDGKIYREALR